MSIARRLVVCLLAVFAATAAPAMAAGTVQIGISGAGSVSATGIGCAKAVGGSLSGDCSEAYANTIKCTSGPSPICFPVFPSVTFTAAGSGASGFAFDSWTGECAGQGASCTISILGDYRFSAVFKDVADPTVTLTAPGVLLSGNASFTAVAADNVGVARVDFTLGGVTVSDTSAPYAASFDTRAVANGVNRVKAVAVDTSGRTKEHGVDVVVDNPVPVVEVPAPAPAGGADPGPAAAPVAATPAPLQSAKTGSSAPQIRVNVVFTFKDGTRTHTRLTSLVVKGVPSGATVSAKGFKKTNASGDVSLKKLLKKPFKAGSTITITISISKPGMATAIKTVKIRPRKTPTVSTKCQAPGATKATAC